MSNHLFNIFFVIWSIVYGIIALPTLLLPANLTVNACKPWIYVIMKALHFFCGITYEIRGMENIPKHGQTVFISKHHSTLETLLLSYIINKPVYILKKALLEIPLFGWYLIAMKMIPIDSTAYAKSFKTMIRSIRDNIKKGRNIVIFPEGGRVGIREEKKYQRGISAIYSDKHLTDINHVPIALNCGVFWPKKTFGKKSGGTVIIKFLPRIKKSLPRDTFMRYLEHTINTESIELVNEGLDEIANR